MPAKPLRNAPDAIDLLVIGAGTAGRQAALAAAEAGLAVHLVTAQPATSRDGHGAADHGVDEGVHLWFEHSALGLLRDAAGRVCGAHGVAGADEQAWRQVARAVVLATGAAPIGLLLASEAGARLQPGDGHPGGAATADGGWRTWHLATDDAAGDSGVAGLWITGQAAGAPRALGLLPPDSLAAQLLAARRTGLAAAAWIDAQPAGLGDGPAASAAPGAAPVPGQASARVGGGDLPHPRARPAGPMLDPQAARQTLAAVLGTLALAPPGDRQALRTGRQQLDALWQFLRLAGPAPRGRQRSARDALARVDLARRALAGSLDAWPAQPVAGAADDAAARRAAPAAIPHAAATANPARWQTLQAYAR